MEVRYTLKLKDFVAMNLYLTRKSGAGRTRYLVAWLGPVTLFVAGAAWLLVQGHEVAACAPAIFAVFWLLTIPPRYRAGLERNVRTFVKRLGARGVLGERALILSEELLVVVTETYHTEVRWENLQGIEVVGDYTYIFIAGISAVILPRHGCASDEEYEATRDFALRKLADRGREDGPPQT
jgi:hypothetical protein